jgi:hypothetical protein
VTSSVVWVDAKDKLPDEEITVLLALDDGEVWTGFLDSGTWRYVSADMIEERVMYWAEFPAPPNA